MFTINGVCRGPFDLGQVSNTTILSFYLMYYTREWIDLHFPTSLTDSQLQNLISDLKRKVSMEPGHCPSCGSSVVIKKGHTSSGSQRYKCKRCGILFVTGHPTIFPNSHIDIGVWEAFITGHLGGNTLRRCSKRCNVCLKTSYLMKNRLIESIRRSEGYPGVLFHGEVMFDECSVI